jgi:hypothetical protein
MKKPLQAETIQGSDNLNITENGYNGYVPPKAFTALSWEAANIVHGTAALTLHIRDGKLARYETSRVRSFMESPESE